MADFKPAFEFLLVSEGRTLFNDPENDEFSKFGITAKFLIDKGLTTEEHARAFVKSLKQEDSEYLYEKYFWREPKISALANQRIANKTFDFYVNSPRWAIKVLQKCLGVPEDGIIGPKTLAAERALPLSAVQSFLKRYSEEQWKVYERIMEANPSKRKFAKVWRRRADRF
jgi:lysozyme family protein